MNDWCCSHGIRGRRGNENKHMTTKEIDGMDIPLLDYQQLK
jgi:hypothetical protein